MFKPDVLIYPDAPRPTTVEGIITPAIPVMLLTTCVLLIDPDDPIPT